MNKDIITNMLVSSARKTMLENVDSIDDIKFLQKELKEHLKKEFDLQNQLEEKDKAIDEIYNYCKSNISECESEQSDDEWECCIEELKGVLEILERGKNVNINN